MPITFLGSTWSSRYRAVWMPKLPPPPRIAYVFDAISLPRPGPKLSLNDGPEVVAGVAGLLEKRDPFLGIAVVFSRQHPTLEDVSLLRSVIAIDLNESATIRHALDLLHNFSGARSREVVHC